MSIIGISMSGPWLRLLCNRCGDKQETHDGKLPVRWTSETVKIETPYGFLLLSPMTFHYCASCSVASN